MAEGRMIGLVLVTHGRLASEFIHAVEHVVGRQEQIEAICIAGRELRHFLLRLAAAHLEVAEVFQDELSHAGESDAQITTGLENSLVRDDESGGDSVEPVHPCILEDCRGSRGCGSRRW